MRNSQECHAIFQSMGPLGLAFADKASVNIPITTALPFRMSSRSHIEVKQSLITMVRRLPNAKMLYKPLNLAFLRPMLTNGVIKITVFARELGG